MTAPQQQLGGADGLSKGMDLLQFIKYVLTSVQGGCSEGSSENGKMHVIFWNLWSP